MYHLTIDRMLMIMFNRRDDLVEMWYNTHHPVLNGVPQEIMKTPQGYDTVYTYLHNNYAAP